MVKVLCQWLPFTEQDTFPLRDSNIDFPATVKKALVGVMEEAYDYIITEYTESECQPPPTNASPPPTNIPVFSAEEKRDHMFASMMHQWGIHGSSVFSNVIRHCVDNEELFDETVNKLIVSHGSPRKP